MTIPVTKTQKGLSMGADNWTDCPKCGTVGELREDYEIGIYKGKFSVSYGAICEACNFEFPYKHEQAISDYKSPSK